MKRKFLLVTILSLFCGSFFTAFTVSSERKTLEPQSPPIFRQAVAFAVSAPVDSFAPARPETGKTSRQIEKQDEETKEIKNKERIRASSSNAFRDQENSLAATLAEPMPTPILSFDGLSSNDNAAAFGFRAVPPDATGDAGPNNYVQAVNVLLRVYDKTGNPETPPFKMSSLFAPLNTACARRDDGDPIVNYDQLADRWILSSFCTAQPPFRQMLAVSQTNNPTGKYYLYEFAMPNFKLNDYAKIGVWHDAYLMTTDEFLGSDFAGTGAFAFDRERMLAGDAGAGYVYFDLDSPELIRLGGMLPADLDGLRPPPADAPAIFVSFTANEYGDESDALRLFDFQPNFVNPNLSTFRERAESPLEVAAFDPTSPPDRADIAQPAPGVALDSQSDRLMYRVAYRNFGARDSLVLNQTVRATSAEQTYQAGVRFYELSRNLNAANPVAQPFTVKNQATIGDANASRWMASAAQDFQGNLAVGYSVSSAEKKPSIVYSGRAANDAANAIRGEQILQTGTGVQTAFGFRWGDYSTLTVDGFDDCTFWYTNEYYTAESQQENPLGWKTRVGTFKFPTCQNAPRAAMSGTVTDALTARPIANAVLRFGDGFIRRTDENGNYSFFLAPDEGNLTANAAGYRGQAVSISLSDGAMLTQNFVLQPSASLQNLGIELTAESCNRNYAFEPGETVTINLPLKNAGAVAGSNLVVSLEPNDRIKNVSLAQNYGSIAVGQTAVRSFTFTVSPDLACGESLVLVFQVRDNGEIIGNVTQEFKAGARKIVLLESFNNSAETSFPAGWTTSASGAQEIWRKILIEPTRSDFAAFSDESIGAGINSLISPIFPVFSPGAVLTFRNKYDLEATFLRNKFYDGAVLEIRYNRGQWRDILQAGGTFASGGYDGVIDDCCQNPLAGRQAWSSKSGIFADAAFVDTRVALPRSAVGKKVQFRWRVGTDVGGRRSGQWIDNVEVQDGFVCSCAKQ